MSKGLELGLSPWRALQGINVIEGVPELSAGLMQSLILERDPTAIVRVLETSTDAVELEGVRRRAGGNVECRVRFTMEDAMRANLLRMKTRRGDWIDSPAWKKHPEDMLYARALSRLARRVWPDVIQGCYVTGEIETTAPPPVPDESHDRRWTGSPPVEIPPSEDTWQGEVTTHAEISAAWQAAVKRRPSMDYTVVLHAAGLPEDWTVENSTEADRKAVLAVLNKIALGKEVA